MNAKRLARLLFLEIEHRGQDATGFAFRDSNGDIQIHKDAMTASEFVKRRLCMPKRAQAAILHVRFSTQGWEGYNENNHPVKAGPIVGVHNGHISNDRELFRMVNYVPQAQVDTEAAMAVLAFGEYKHPTEALELLHGNAALAWFHQDDDLRQRIFLARVNSSPLFVGESAEGSVVFASTEFAVLNAMRQVGMTPVKLRDIPEGTYLELIDGSIEGVRTFEVPRYVYSRYSSSSYRYADDDYEWLNNEDEYVKGNDGIWRKRKHVAELTAAKTGSAVSTDDDVEAYLASTAQQRNERQGVTEAPWMSAWYLRKNTDIPVQTGDAYHMNYAEREVNVEDWLRNLHVPSDEAWWTSANAMKAFVRPGEPVKTEVYRLGEVFGQVYKLPTQFPYGDYVLRVAIPKNESKSDHEFAFVSRKYHQFTVLDNPAKAKRQAEFEDYMTKREKEMQEVSF